MEEIHVYIVVPVSVFTRYAYIYVYLGHFFLVIISLLVCHIMVHHRYHFWVFFSIRCAIVASYTLTLTDALIYELMQFIFNVSLHAFSFLFHTFVKICKCFDIVTIVTRWTDYEKWIFDLFSSLFRLNMCMWVQHSPWNFGWCMFLNVPSPFVWIQ